MATLPVSIRAALGLAATAIDEARKLPETLPQLPVAVIGTAMQASLRVQQHIAEYAVRGDELISQLRGASDEPPSWATFDDDVQSDSATASNGGPAKAAFELIEEADAVLEDDLAPIDPEPSRDAEPEPVTETEPVTEPAAGTQPAQPSAGPASNAGAEADAGSDADAGQTAAKKSAAKAGPAKKTAAKPTPADKTTAAKKPAKKVTRSEPLAVAAERAEPTDRPNPSVMAAEIVQAHQGETSPGES